MSLNPRSLVMRSQVDTASFRRWFGDSKVVDVNGNPELSTHYTDRVFTEFSVEEQQRAKTEGSGYTTSFGRSYIFPETGFFFFVGDVVPQPVGKKTVAVRAYLSIQNPLDLTKRISPEETSRIIDFIQERATLVPKPGHYGYTPRGDKLGGFRKARKEGVTPQQLWGFLTANEYTRRGLLWDEMLTVLGKDGVLFDGNSSGTALLESERGLGNGQTYRIAVALKPNQIKFATGNRGAFDINSLNILHSFAGPAAQTSDKFAFGEAVRRLQGGDDAEQVRHDTGWFNGIDGKMRTEISDDQSMPTEILVNPVAREIFWNSVYDMQKRRIDSAKRKALKNLHAANDEIDRVRRFTGETFDSHAPKSAILCAAYDIKDAALDVHRKMMATHPHVVLTLSDLLDHKQLFAAYPQLRGIVIHFTQACTPGCGSFHEDSQTIELSPRSTPEQNHSVLLHEIQHAIQYFEGFALGGSPEGMVRYAIEASRGVLENEYSALPSYQMATKEGRIGDWVLKTIQTTGKGISPYESYRRLAGEAEARNVQRRLAMTQDERQKTSPNSTLDVPIADLIVEPYPDRSKQCNHSDTEQNAWPLMLADIAPHLSEAVLDDIQSTLVAHPKIPPSGMDAMRIRQFLRVRRAAYDALIERLIFQADGIVLPTQSGGYKAVGRDVRPDGIAWRVTSFDADMTPLGHDPCETAPHAVRLVFDAADASRLSWHVEYLRKKNEQMIRARTERDL